PAPPVVSAVASGASAVLTASRSAPAPSAALPISPLFCPGNRFQPTSGPRSRFQPTFALSTGFNPLLPLTTGAGPALPAIPVSAPTGSVQDGGRSGLKPREGAEVG